MSPLLQSSKSIFWKKNVGKVVSKIYIILFCIYDVKALSVRVSSNGKREPQIFLRDFFRKLFVYDFIASPKSKNY